ncbi:MAG: hypothetical protein RL578_486 [Chloroflexota bacterium]|nr:MAG: hypothetical protein DWI56_00530 [Candidatus Limnocylindrus sp.]RLT49020.1 MAG: hypothetical protein DWI65_02170 [Candidatus Limnocylindrus sp. ZSMar2m-chloro-G89]
MTLVNESPTQKPGRAARDHADVALKAAAEGRWQEAADANRAVLAFAAEIKVEERIEAQNRLAKCLWELGDLAGSKKEYQVTLTLDPLNRIAERNLERLKGLIKQVGKKTTPSSEGATTPAGIFIQEAGTTGFAHLTNVADVATLAQVNPGDAVELLTLSNRLIAKANGVEIGRVEPRIAARLLKLIADGNVYSAGITSISGGDIRIIIREESVSAKNLGKVSFPTATRTNDERPYTKGSFFREDEGFSDDDDDDTYEDDAPVADRVTAEPPEKTADDAFLPESEEAGSSEE